MSATLASSDTVPGFVLRSAQRNLVDPIGDSKLRDVVCPVVLVLRLRAKARSLELLANLMVNPRLNDHVRRSAELAGSRA